MKKLALLLIPILGLTSCLNFEEPLFYFSEMADVSGGSLINDNGIRYNVTDGEMSANISGYSRVFINGFATKAYDPGSTYDYDVRIESIWQVTVKDPVKVSSIKTEEEDTYGDSPVLMSKGWLAGGYLNFVTIVSHRRNSSYLGSITLLYDDTKSSGGDFYFELRNKQEGDTWANPSMDESSIVFENVLISVPITEIIPDGMSTDQMKLYVDYKWFESVEGAVLPLHTEKMFTGTCSIGAE